jgi:hypothetical protein
VRPLPEACSTTEGCGATYNSTNISSAAGWLQVMLASEHLEQAEMGYANLALTRRLLRKGT